MTRTPEPMPAEEMIQTAVQAAEAAGSWQPRLSGPSGYLEHLPALAWLTRVLQPRQVIGLGIGTGVGYFTLCQAAAGAGLESDLYGIELWRSPEGLLQVPEGLQQHNAAQYAGASRLVAADPRTAADVFDMEDIDLLLVDLDPAADLAGLLAGRWAPLLQRRGVIVLRGAADAAPVRDLLGLWPHLVFPQGGGMAVLLVGQALPPVLSALAALPAEDPAGQAFFRGFAAAGAALAERAAEVSARSRLADLTRELEAARAELAGFEVTRQELAAASSALMRRDTALAEQAARLETLAQSESAARTELARQAGEVTVLTRLAEEARLAAEVAGRAAGEADLRAAADAGRLKALKLREQTLLRVALDKGQRHEKAARALGLARAEVQSLRTQLLAAREEVAALRGSTSWKVTEPLRRVRRIVSRDPAPPAGDPGRSLP